MHKELLDALAKLNPGWNDAEKLFRDVLGRNIDAAINLGARPDMVLRILDTESVGLTEATTDS
jgi:hypothetical protein